MLFPRLMTYVLIIHVLGGCAGITVAMGSPWYVTILLSTAAILVGVHLVWWVGELEIYAMRVQPGQSDD